ncbi:hypothetical protein [Brachybacterium saurashtrense]|uniref:hypothetical protein n=1 Tax=Brachybacterium saurashtrense TaxID=556288 RepID=UPI001F49E42D|nr:hypothetical protein [Brachybacterium saurashtrense]
MPEEIAGFLAAVDAGIAAGALDGEPGVLESLIGRPATPLVDVLRADPQVTAGH